MNALPEPIPQLPDYDLTPETINELGDLIDHIAREQLDPIRASDNPDMLARISLTLEQARQRLSDLERAAKHALHECMPKKMLKVDGVQFERTGGRERKWDSKAALNGLTQQLVDPTTGVVVEAIPTEVMSKAAYISYFRSKALEAMGVDPDRFSEFVSCPKTVRIHR